VSVSAQKEPSEIGYLVDISSFQLATKRPSWRNGAANASHGMPEINYQSASYWKYSNRDITDRDTARKNLTQELSGHIIELRRLSRALSMFLR
jgi:hypothetical protein